MKIIKEKLELGKAMENNNSNMKKIDGVDTVVAVDPGYAKALSDEEKTEKHISDVMEETDKAAEGITPEDPKTGKALPKTAYTEQEKVDEGLELDESLFEDIRKVDTLPNDVYTLVYDLLFPGLNDIEKKPHLVAKEEEITVPEEKSFIDLEGADIGVQIKSEEDEGIVAYVKKIAEILGLETYEKKVPGELKYGDHILAIKIPEELSEKNATEFLANLGIDEEGIRGKYKIKEAYGQDEIRGEIGRYFDYAVDGDFVDVVEDIIDRVDDPQSTDDIMQAIDDGLIYTSDQWTVLEHYCTPQTANWEDAIDEFVNDIYHIVDALNKSEDEEEDEETEVEVEETDESLKEENIKEARLRFPRFELEIWVPGSGGDDERERPLIKTDDIDEVLETVYKTKLDSGEAFLFTDVRRNFQLDQEYSREQLFDDIKDRLGDEYDLSGWDEYFVETNAVYDFEESKKCEEKECEEKKLDEDAKVISSLSEFKPWSGAEATWDKIIDADKFDDLDAYIEEMYPDGIDETDLNDLLWFDGDSVLEALGISEEDETEEDETDESLSEDKENPELDKKNNKNIGGIAHL